MPWHSARLKPFLLPSAFSLILAVAMNLIHASIHHTVGN
jgi:hypothetical protein